MNTTSLPEPLVHTLDLLERAREHMVLLDASFDLADPGLGQRQYLESRLPGARHVHLERDLSGDTTGPDGRFRGRHPLPSREAFAATVGALGITPVTPVVVYDRQGSMYAARAWWMLRWIGHRSVAVLDGGLAAWQAAGGRLESGAPAAMRAAPPYPLAPPGMATIEAADLLERLGRVPLIDARAPERFRGDVEPLDRQAGHIPGAHNRFFKDNLVADGSFRSAAALRVAFVEIIGDASPDTVVQQCGSGVTACHNLLAMEVAGLSGSVLYPGSWSEWSADAQRPVARA